MLTIWRARKWKTRRAYDLLLRVIERNKMPSLGSIHCPPFFLAWKMKMGGEICIFFWYCHAARSRLMHKHAVSWPWHRVKGEELTPKCMSKSLRGATLLLGWHVCWRNPSFFKMNHAKETVFHYDIRREGVANLLAVWFPSHTHEEPFAASAISVAFAASANSATFDASYGVGILQRWKRNKQCNHSFQLLAYGINEVNNAIEMTPRLQGT